MPFPHTQTQDDAALKPGGFCRGVARTAAALPADAAVVWLGLHLFADRAFSLPFPLEGTGYDPDLFSDALVPGSYAAAPLALAG